MLTFRNRFPLLKIIFIGFLPNRFKKIVYRLRGYSIGKGVRLGIGSVIIGKNVSVGDYAKIGFLTILRAETIKIGRFVDIGAFTFLDTRQIEIGEDTRIREQVYAGGLQNPDSLLKIGKRCLIMQFTSLNPTKPITIDDDSAIGGYSLLFTHSSWLSVLEGYPVRFGPITIGKKVWIPFRTFITSGVTIGDHVIISPNSLISQDIPSESIAGGYPLQIKPNFFHRELKPEKKVKIFFDILTEFLDYLMNSWFHVSEEKEDTFTKYGIDNKQTKHSIFLFHDSFTSSVLNKNMKNTLVVLLNVAIKEMPFSENFEPMIISLFDLNRFGSSDVGEEFVRYCSRYGIRFNRMD